MDDYSIYSMLLKRNIRPFIPLPDNTKFPDMGNYPQIKKFDDKGRPLCPAGYYWIHWGFDKTKMRHKYRCPFAARNQPIPNCLTCIDCNKKKSSYGPAFYIKSSESLAKLEESMGYRILMTNNHAWGTKEIIQTYNGQSFIENTFKNMKNQQHLSLNPQYHWTGQKIKVHNFCCVIAYLITSLIYKNAKEKGFTGTIDTPRQAREHTARNGY